MGNTYRNDLGRCGEHLAGAGSEVVARVTLCQVVLTLPDFLSTVHSGTVIWLSCGWKSDKVMNGWLLEFYVLTTSKVILGWGPTCYSAHSWRLHSAVPLGYQATRTII